MRKVLVICIDGATFDLLDPLLDKLPTIQKLKTVGCYGNLFSVYPPITPPAWASFITGKNPGKHGVFDFIDVKNREKTDVVDASHIDSESLWSILSRNGVKVGVLNIPLTYPPEKVNGFLVPGLLSRTISSYPPSLMDELKEKVGYAMTPVVMGMSKDEAYDILEKDHAVKEKAALYLLRKDWDFFMVELTLTDYIGHRYFASSPATLEKAFIRVDETIGKLVSSVPSDTDIIVMSDHGFGKCEKNVNLNNYFISKKFIKFKPWGRIKYFLFKRNLNPMKLYSLAKKAGLQKIVNKMPGKRKKYWANKLLGYRDIDWKQTICYTKGSFGPIYINKDCGDHEENKKKIISALRELEFNGEKLVDSIVTKEEMYHGKYARDGPDLFVVLKGMSYLPYSQFASNNQLVTESVYTNEWEGTHRMTGIFIANGPDFRKKKNISEYKLVDLTKTILNLFGLSGEGTDMDGTVMEDALISKIPQKEVNPEKSKLKDAIGDLDL
ncbi:MAG TPA: alkaline phosphatase family protein [Candidatus Nanoarchaeia archaeon]|nr:alkaline phosphatase family protein [Candidatus Nanoarchaeia archaeon]